MASALEKAFKGVLKKSESQKVFSPWWSDAEDKLLYAVMILGKTGSERRSHRVFSGCGRRTANRKRKETKQQPGTAGPCLAVA